MNIWKPNLPRTVGTTAGTQPQPSLPPLHAAASTTVHPPPTITTHPSVVTPHMPVNASGWQIKTPTATNPWAPATDGKTTTVQPPQQQQINQQQPNQQQINRVNQSPHQPQRSSNWNEKENRSPNIQPQMTLQQQPKSQLQFPSSRPPTSSSGTPNYPSPTIPIKSGPVDTAPHQLQHHQSPPILNQYRPTATTMTTNGVTGITPSLISTGGGTRLVPTAPSTISTPTAYAAASSLSSSTTAPMRAPYSSATVPPPASNFIAAATTPPRPAQPPPQLPTPPPAQNIWMTRVRPPITPTNAASTASSSTAASAVTPNPHTPIRSSFHTPTSSNSSAAFGSATNASATSSPFSAAAISTTARAASSMMSNRPALPPPTVSSNMSLPGQGVSMNRQFAPSSPKRTTSPKPNMNLDPHQACENYLNQFPNRRPNMLEWEFISTYLYPRHLSDRAYQRDIVWTCLRYNTLVCLPTGTGKTLIACVVMYNYFRWYPQSRVVFLAPTKPLVVQQQKACCQMMGIPVEYTAIVMGGNQEVMARKQIWQSDTKRMLFGTPQAVMKDIQKGVVPLNSIVCLVVDECHKATGAYSYVEVVKSLIMSDHDFRVIGLSATPGADLRAVKEVFDHLKLQRLELRDESDEDLRPYLQTREIEKVLIEANDSTKELREALNQCLVTPLKSLAGAGIGFSQTDPNQVYPMTINNARNQFQMHTPAHISEPQKWSVIGEFGICYKLLQAREKLGYGVQQCWTFLQEHIIGDDQGRVVNTNKEKKSPTTGAKLDKKPASAATKTVRESFAFRRLKELIQNSFLRMDGDMMMIDAAAAEDANDDAATSSSSNHVHAMGMITSIKAFHPKIGKLVELVAEHFRKLQEKGEWMAEEEDGDESPDEDAPIRGRQSKSDIISFKGCATQSNVIVFTQFRESVDEIVSHLNKFRDYANIRAGAFIGQAGKNGISQSSKNGMSQKQQASVLQQFRDGSLNVIVATCVAEEGLDIGHVDLIISYDVVGSPLRIIQRFGRTGRKRRGRCITLVEKGKEELTYDAAWAAKNSFMSELKKHGKQPFFAMKGKFMRMIPDGILPIETLIDVQTTTQKKPQSSRASDSHCSWTVSAQDSARLRSIRDEAAKIPLNLQPPLFPSQLPQPHQLPYTNKVHRLARFSAFCQEQQEQLDRMDMSDRTDSSSSGDSIARSTTPTKSISPPPPAPTTSGDRAQSSSSSKKRKNTIHQLFSNQQQLEDARHQERQRERLAKRQPNVIESLTHLRPSLAAMFPSSEEAWYALLPSYIHDHMRRRREHAIAQSSSQRQVSPSKSELKQPESLPSSSTTEPIQTGVFPDDSADDMDDILATMSLPNVPILPPAATANPNQPVNVEEIKSNGEPPPIPPPQIESKQVDEDVEMKTDASSFATNGHLSVPPAFPDSSKSTQSCPSCGPSIKAVRYCVVCAAIVGCAGCKLLGSQCEECIAAALCGSQESGTPMSIAKEASKPCVPLIPTTVSSTHSSVISSTFGLASKPSGPMAASVIPPTVPSPLPFPQPVQPPLPLPLPAHDDDGDHFFFSPSPAPLAAYQPPSHSSPTILASSYMYYSAAAPSTPFSQTSMVESSPGTTVTPSEFRSAASALPSTTNSSVPTIPQQQPSIHAAHSNYGHYPPLPPHPQIVPPAAKASTSIGTQPLSIQTTSLPFPSNHNLDSEDRPLSVRDALALQKASSHVSLAAVTIGTKEAPIELDDEDQPIVSRFSR